MENTTPENMPTDLASIGAANFLRGMANDQMNQNHALAMGQAQMRQMMGSHWKDTAPGSEEMKIAAHGITETTTNHYHFHGSGKDDGQADGESIATTPSAPGPSPSASNQPPASGGLIRKMAPLLLASTLGATGLFLGQALNRLWTTPSPQVAPAPSPKVNNPTPPPSPQISPPSDHPAGGAIIINPERPDLIWELDLGKPKGAE